MTCISRIAIATALTFCTFASLQGESSAATETRRLCDRRGPPMTSYGRLMYLPA